MAILSRVKISPQQRYDLEDFLAGQSAARSDSKLWTQKFLSSENLIMQGFSISGLGLNEATVNMANAALIIPENSFDFSYFISAPAEPNVTITDAQLVDNVRNFIEVELTTLDGVPLTKAFWDPEAQAGLGAEFNQIVNTITDLRVNFVSLTGGFSGSPDRLPVAIIDTDNSGVIKLILDRREMFGRLAKPNDLDNEYSWGTKQEPVYSLVMTGTAGSFTAGETINIGSETATVVSGGNPSITFNRPSGINFASGDAVSGVDSGASGTVDTVLESFSGVDKSLATQKEINDALMTEIKQMKGTAEWYSGAFNSINGLSNLFNSIITQAVAAAEWSWDGSEFSITDGSGTPADADVLANIQILGDSRVLELTRQDGTGGSTTLSIADGEVLFVELPDSGTRTYSGSGSANTEFQVVAQEDFIPNDTNYWLAYRQGTRIYIRGYGELQPNESAPISDPAKAELESQIAAVQVNNNQDRNTKLVEGGTWSVVDNAGTLELTLSADAYAMVAGLLPERNTISAQQIDFAAVDEVATIELLRDDVAVPSVRTVTVTNNDALVQTDDTFVFARRVSDGILIGNSFLVKPGEFLELDAALAEINRYFGQARIEPHPSNGDRFVITGLDVDKLSGSSISQTLNNLLVSFDGAEVDVETGDVFESDGTTPLGINFTPPTVAASQWRWLSVTLVANTLGSDNRLSLQVLVIPASADGATQDAAPRASFATGIPLGQVAIQRNAGDTEFEDVGYSNIVQLGVGSGSGSGGGSGSSFLSVLENTLALSPFCYLTPSVFSLDEDELIDPSSTGAFSVANSTFSFSAATETLVSVNLVDEEFINQLRNTKKVKVVAQWDLDNIDTGATYEVRRSADDADYQTVTMERVGETDVYEGVLTLEDIESVFDFDATNNTASGTQALTDVAGGFDTLQTPVDAGADVVVIKPISLDITKNGSATGNYFVKLVKDDGGNPSTDPNDIVWESAFRSIDDLSAGLNSITIDAPDTTVITGDNWLVIGTDQDYKTAYTSNSSDNITFDVDGSSQVNSTVEGYALNLQLRITASAAAELKSFGVLYDEDFGNTPVNIQKNVEYFSFSLDSAPASITLTKFLPDPRIVKIFDLRRGQVYAADRDTFTVSGNDLVFSADLFDDPLDPNREVRLKVEQIEGNGFDNADQNAQSIADLEDRIETPPVKDETGTSYTLLLSDAATVVTLDNAGAITLNLPDDLPVGYNLLVVQKGAGGVTFSPQGGATLQNRQGHTTIAGQWGVASLVVIENTGGNSAVYVLAGDTA